MYYFFIHLTCEFLDLDFPGLVCKFIVWELIMWDSLWGRYFQTWCFATYEAPCGIHLVKPITFRPSLIGYFNLPGIRNAASSTIYHFNISLAWDFFARLGIFWIRVFQAVWMHSWVFNESVFHLWPSEKTTQTVNWERPICWESSEVWKKKEKKRVKKKKNRWTWTEKERRRDIHDPCQEKRLKGGSQE